MSKTRTFTGSVTAVNTITNLTIQGSNATPTTTVPGTSANKIARIIVVAASDFLGLGNAVYFIRLTGDGIKNGEQDIMVGAGGGQIVTTASSDAKPFVIGNNHPSGFGDCDIDCVGGGTINVAAEMAESDIGSVGIAVTLEFDHD